jgi:hypothetical protein
MHRGRSHERRSSSHHLRRKPTNNVTLLVGVIAEPSPLSSFEFSARRRNLVVVATSARAQVSSSACPRRRTAACEAAVEVVGAPAYDPFLAASPSRHANSQKSGLSAVGSDASVPGNHWVFSAQTASAQSAGPRQ